jgi:pimeloyl-ACP methyl ester carboxylesterase
VREGIEFESDGVTLRGFRYPAHGEGPHPVVMMSHGWGATLAMGLEPYAEAFSAAGYSTVLFDNPNFGISDGEPRQEINPWARTRAMSAAVEFATELDGHDPDRIAIWGDSGDAARVFLDAATDDRVAALIAYNPTFGASLPDAAPSREAFERISEVVRSESVAGTEGLHHGPEPIVSADPSIDCMSPSPQAFRWFLEYGGRHGSGWINEWSYAVPDLGVEHSPYDCLPQVTVPALLVAGNDDEIEWCVPGVQEAALRLTSGPQVWRQIDGGHFGALYHPSRAAEEMTKIQVEFLDEYL